MKHPDHAADYLAAIGEIATGSGVTGMIGGQVMDLYCEHQRTMDESALSYIQRNKTACMFIYPLRAAGRICGSNTEQLAKLESYGQAFGLLFQATDDLLDVTGNVEEMGKTLGKDAASGKLTCISAYGVEGTKQLINDLYIQAIEAMKEFQPSAGADFFVSLVQNMIGRTN